MVWGKYLSDLTPQQEEDLCQRALQLDQVEGVSSFSQTQDSVSDMLQGLNAVVVLIVICASSLAFIVLYNLTNINITERIREIATIKVLGFRDKEVNAYVYRENVVLTVIGMVVGLSLIHILLICQQWVLMSVTQNLQKNIPCLDVSGLIKSENWYRP